MRSPTPIGSIDPLEFRKVEHPIEPLILRRWSPRAMSGEPLTDDELFPLFEAARWAPSTFNEQEWRFLYSRRHDAHWNTFLGLLAEANQIWCARAGVLVCVLSHMVFSRNGKPNPVHVFDSGAAFENLAIQGCAMGLVVHGMAGFDAARARRDLRVPDDFSVNAMIAIGHPGDPADLPPDLAERESPSGRHPLSHSVCAGPFNF